MPARPRSHRWKRYKSSLHAELARGLPTECTQCAPARPLRAGSHASAAAAVCRAAQLLLSADAPPPTPARQQAVIVPLHECAGTHTRSVDPMHTVLPRHKRERIQQGARRPACVILLIIADQSQAKLHAAPAQERRGGRPAHAAAGARSRVLAAASSDRRRLHAWPHTLGYRETAWAGSWTASATPHQSRHTTRLEKHAMRCQRRQRHQQRDAASHTRTRAQCTRARALRTQRHMSSGALQHASARSHSGGTCSAISAVALAGSCAAPCHTTHTYRKIHCQARSRAADGCCCCTPPRAAASRQAAACMLQARCTAYAAAAAAARHHKPAQRQQQLHSAHR